MRKIPLILVLALVISEPALARKSKKSAAIDAIRESESMMTSPPQDNELCFSPDEPCAGKIVKFIESAKTSLDIAIFEMTDRKIAEAIATASKTVKVRMVVNRKLVKDSGPAFDILRAAGVPIRIGAQKGIMHNKFTIVDGRRLETGSFNYTYAAENSNQENQFYLSTPGVLDRYKARFEKMWRAGKITASTSQ